MTKCEDVKLSKCQGPGQRDWVELVVITKHKMQKDKHGYLGENSERTELIRSTLN